MAIATAIAAIAAALLRALRLQICRIVLPFGYAAVCTAGTFPKLIGARFALNNLLSAVSVLVTAAACLLSVSFAVTAGVIRYNTPFYYHAS